jgi:hypothetical protein
MKSDDLIVQIAGVADLKDEVSKLRKGVEALLLEIQQGCRGPQLPEQRYLSLREMKKYTGLSPNTILKYFTPVKLDGKLIFDKISVDAILKNLSTFNNQDELHDFKARINSLISKAS